MSEEKFAKIVEVGGRQVLFYIDRDADAPDDDRLRLHQIVHMNGIEADVALGGIRPLGSNDDLLAKCDEVRARKLIDTISDIGLTGSAGAQ